MAELDQNHELRNVRILRALIDGTPDVVYVKDLEGKYRLLNAAAVQVTGKSESEIWGQDDSVLFPPDEAKVIMDLDRTVLRDGASRTFEETVTSPSSGVRHFLTTKGPIYDQAGRVVGLFGMARDITERVRMEASLKKLNERLLMAQQAALVGVWDWDILTGKIDWSLQMFELFGLDPEKAIPSFEVWRALIHPDDLGVSGARIDEALKGKSMLSSEYRIVFPDGQIRWIFATGKGFYDTGGAPIRMLGICQDVTARKIAELKLRENETLLTSIIDSTPSSIFAFDRDQRFVLINQAMADFYEMQKSEVLGKTLFDVFPKDIADRLYAANARIIEKGESLFIEEEVANKRTGAMRTMITAKFPLKDTLGKVIGLGGVATEITERKRLESKLLEAKEAAEAASRSRATFLDIAAHELRTPVTSISLLIQALRRQMDRGHAIDPKVFSRIYEPVERLSRLVVDLLDISRLERGLIGLKKVNADLGALLKTCVSEIQLIAPHREIIFDQPRAGIFLEIDPVRIHQVVSNLLENAVKYTPETGPIEVKLEKRENAVRVSVVDQGPGIPSEQLEKLFSAFSRGKSEAAIRASGLGLGLSVCRGIVELHGGTIHVSTEVGRGSTFYFDLPLDGATS